MEKAVADPCVCVSAVTPGVQSCWQLCQPFCTPSVTLIRVSPWKSGLFAIDERSMQQ